MRPIRLKTIRTTKTVEELMLGDVVVLHVDEKSWANCNVGEIIAKLPTRLGFWVILRDAWTGCLFGKQMNHCYPRSTKPRRHTVMSPMDIQCEFLIRDLNRKALPLTYSRDHKRVRYHVEGLAIYVELRCATGPVYYGSDDKLHAPNGAVSKTNFWMLVSHGLDMGIVESPFDIGSDLSQFRQATKDEQFMFCAEPEVYVEGELYNRSALGGATPQILAAA